MASSSTPATPLLYSCIAYHNTVLTEHTTSAVSGTSGLAAVILPKIQHETAQKLTYTHNENFIHYIADAPPSSSNPDSLSAGGLTYMVVARAELGRRIPFGYLVEIKKRFLKEYDPERTKFASLPAYGAAAFNGQLKQLMVDYGTTKAGKDDAFANVQNEIDNVRGIMTENIERVLERGERIDLLVDKTDRLGGSARDFRVRSRGLRRKMWWKNVRLMVMMVVVIIFLVYLLVGFGCGLPGKHCTPFTQLCSYERANEMSSLEQMHQRMSAQQIDGCGVQAIAFSCTSRSSYQALSPHPSASSSFCCAETPLLSISFLSFTSSTMNLKSSSPFSARLLNSSQFSCSHCTSPPAAGTVNPSSVM